jgi:PTH1 family peptidyl-tRNA hydrolase
MKLVVGIGNPGEKYKNTRHNAGFLVADVLTAQIQNSKFEALNKSRIRIFKSQNFMNESGIFVKKLVEQYKVDLSNLYIVHDDLDVPLGSYKIQFGIGPKVHNGVKSVDEALGTDQYWHVRIGVDNRPPDYRQAGIEYVLENFTNDEKEILNKTIKEVTLSILSFR